MRIISGRCGGRMINPPKNLRARPTTDFAKENLFNILTNIVEFEDKTVLDFFAGTGSISLEFLLVDCHIRIFETCIAESVSERPLNHHLSIISI